MYFAPLPMLALALSIPATNAPVATPAEILPMEMDDNNHPVINLSLSGRADPLRFITDSAAGATLLDSCIARRHGLEDDKAGATLVQGATNNRAEIRRLRSTTWKLGNLQLEAAVMQADLGGSSCKDASGMAGILGNDITRRWDTRWDFAAKQLQLWPPGSLPNGAHCQANALPARKSGLQGFGFIKVFLGKEGVEAIALVDTGAAATVLNIAAAQTLGVRTDGSDARVKVSKSKFAGLGGRAQSSWAYELPAMASGSWQRPAMEVFISEMQVFNTLGLAERPALILGNDAMAGAQIDITAGAGRICLQAPPAS
ncbi:retropepsin-like domain-containing protein [Stenotrophomonas sp. Br8]|uniref:aspartyl protease family protein n=1 Tax=Stenotrophomonas sp. Br8 TaxID=2759658 RepID=UPI00168A7FEA|nr:retropepsin-like aspartic protease [Stenotrophomonas sp. Br8]MBD3680311.1 retropepsin-like domain-containing protein [Stenotrophomonas sp. Br8]